MLLDEPTNHLDIESCESLIEAINEFCGSVIMVTHNEDILHAVVTKLIIFDRNIITITVLAVRIKIKIFLTC